LNLRPPLPLIFGRKQTKENTDMTADDYEDAVEQALEAHNASDLPANELQRLIDLARTIEGYTVEETPIKDNGYLTIIREEGEITYIVNHWFNDLITQSMPVWDDYIRWIDRGMTGVLGAI
jgi:hypothetical protein